MQYRLSTWKHPKTGQIRIYVSGPEIMPEDKCFMFACPPSWTNPGGVDAKIQTNYLGSYTGSLGHHRGNSVNDIGNYYADLALREREWQSATFDSIVAAIEGRGEIVEAPPFVKVPTEAEIERAEMLQSLSPDISVKDRIAGIARIVAKAKKDENALRSIADIKWSKARLKIDRKLEDEITAARIGESFGIAGMKPDDIAQARNRLWKHIEKMRVSDASSQ